jgi:hypothetical protein
LSALLVGHQPVVFKSLVSPPGASRSTFKTVSGLEPNEMRPNVDRANRFARKTASLAFVPLRLA